MDLRRILRPRSIAVAGASDDPASPGAAILRNIAAAGFTGPVHLISPTRPSIGGQPCLKSLRDMPMGVDAVVLNVPRAAIRDAVAACIEREAGGAVVFSAGFSEAGEAGRLEQAEIAEMCRAGGLALLGPNCMGLTDYVGGVPLTFESLQFERVVGARRVGVIAQSGATAANIRSALQARGVPVSHVVTTGNEAVLRADDFIRSFVEDGVTAIAVYVEQIRDPQQFLEVARLARSRQVPIVMVHPGRSARGREAAQSHTGAMAGEYAVMRTLVLSEAVTLVDTMDELFDATAILYRFPAPPQGAAGIVTNSGAVRGLSLDFSEDVGLPIADVSAATLESLRGLLPPHIEIDNPLDVGTAGYSDSSIFGSTTAAMLADPAVGSVLLALTGGGDWQQRAKADAIVPVVQQATKPVAVAIIGDDSPLDAGMTGPMRESETPFFRSPERAIRALAAVHNYAEALAHVAERAPLPPATPRIDGRGTLTEYRGKAFLRDLGIPVPAGELATDVDQAVAVAQQIGFPVVLKAQASTLAHKSDAGAVILGIRDEAELRSAWMQLLDNVARAGQGHELDGVLVEAMVQRGLELVVGGRNDTQWGPVVAVGLGGVWVEALDAVELLPADAGRAQIRQRLLAMKGAKLLGAFRGQLARDVDAVVDVVLRLGAALRANPDLLEIDVNPLVVLPEGSGAIALDALLIMAS